MNDAPQIEDGNAMDFIEHDPHVALENLITCMCQIGEAEEKLAGLREKEKILRTELLLNYDEEERACVARYLYWKTDMTTKELAPLLGNIPYSQVCKLVGPMETGRNCKQCGTPLYWNSRDHRRHGFSETICPECRNIKDIEDSKLYQEEENEREIAKQRNLHELKTMPYAKYLQTEHWQQIRKAALKRAKYRCQTCNSTSVLDVHHRTYERRGEEIAADVIVLCRDCHSKFHGIT